MTKKTTIIILTLLVNFLKGQMCSPPPPPQDIFLANTTSTVISTQYKLLCGPNTVLYDTLTNWNIFAYVNPSTTLTIKSNPPSPHYIWVKNGGTLNVLNNTHPFKLIFEPGAIINNPFNIPTDTVICSNITFPTANCSTTNIQVNSDLNRSLKIFPNPTSDILKLDIWDTKNLKSFQLFNSAGQKVFEDTTFPDGGLKLQKLLNSPGLYFIIITDESSIIRGLFVYDN